jgi:lipid A ethanolaminephosphotransferase
LKKFKNWLANLQTPQTNMVIMTALFIMITGNIAFFSRLIGIYPISLKHAPFLISVTLFFTVATALFLLFLSAFTAFSGRASRWLLAILLVVSSLAAYYMDAYGAIIDSVMLGNMLQTDKNEVAGLLNFSMFVRVILLGFLPAWWVIKQKTKATISNSQPLKTELKSRAKLIGVGLLALVVLVLPFTQNYASFVRQHKYTRMYANPTFYSYSVYRFFEQKFKFIPPAKLVEVAKDANYIPKHSNHELMIMVVGETARFDRFSLNGYHRITNPMLAKEDVLSLKNVSSCGTSTGVSVPCMFSVLKRTEYDQNQALSMQNALDVLALHGVEVLWRDNNSDSKGVALRVPYQNFKTPTNNPVCEKSECRDIGMLAGLDAYIKANNNKDILIVLHQMGNHGPEYYQRYPKAFEQFKPACQTGELSECSQEEVDNAYDNAILYTDYFLSQVIAFLKKYDDQYETAMLYVSDHGESLGENGFWLHAAPYAVAPKEQTHVPAIVWLGKHFDYNIGSLQPYKDYPLSHDDVFCSLLTAFELKTKSCDAQIPWLMQHEDLNAESEESAQH